MTYKYTCPKCKSTDNNCDWSNWRGKDKWYLLALLCNKCGKRWLSNEDESEVIENVKYKGRLRF